MSHPSAAAARKKHTHACCAVTQKARVSFIKAYASKPARQTAVRETPLSAEVRRRVSMGLLEKGIHINSRLNPAHDFFFIYGLMRGIVPQKGRPKIIHAHG